MNDAWSRQLAAYPPALVYTCLALSGIVAIWLCAKIIKWTFQLVLILLVCAAILAGVGWVLGYW